MTTLSINYNHGKGSVKLNLSELMPCTDSDFRRVLSFVGLSDDLRNHAETLRDYIRQEIAVLDVILEQEQKKKVLDRKKRYQSNLKMLMKRYTWLETPQKSFEKQEEKNMNTTYTFTSDSIQKWKSNAGRLFRNTKRCCGGYHPRRHTGTDPD